MQMLRKIFHCEEHWREHRAIQKLDCKVIDFFERDHELWVYYSKGVGDHRFYIRYGLDGDSTILFEHASFDNPKTLKELLKVPKEVEFYKS